MICKSSNILIGLIVINFSFLRSSNPIVISLGHNCIVAGVIKAFNLRKASFPFDWIDSSFNGIYDAIDSDFKDFFLKESLIKSDLIYSEILNGYLTHVIDPVYNFTYIHDFPVNNATINENLSAGIIVENFLDYYLGIYTKYQRRIERFRNILNSDNKVIFIRYGKITYEEALRLSLLLRTKFINLDFLLVLVDISTEMIADWDIPHIKNFYLEKFSWEEIDPWREIFKKLALI